MANQQRGGKPRARETGADEARNQRFGAMDWSQMEPYEEGQMAEMRGDEHLIFGELAHEYLDGPPAMDTDSLRLWGAGGSAVTSGPSAIGDSAGEQGLTPQGGMSAGSLEVQDVCGDATSAGQASGAMHRPSSDEPASLSGTQPQSSQQQQGGARTPKTRGKKKLPVPDLDAIDDPEERRRQRRLIKNRNTAAKSRERKQRQFEEIAVRTKRLEEDNAELRRRLSVRNHEIEHLSLEVAQAAARGGGGGGTVPVSPGAAARGAGSPAPGGQPLEAPSGSDCGSQPLQARSGSGGGGGQPLEARSGSSPGAALTQPQRRGGTSGGLMASGLAPMARPGFIQGMDGQYLFLQSGLRPQPQYGMQPALFQGPVEMQLQQWPQPRHGAEPGLFQRRHGGTPPVISQGSHAQRHIPLASTPGSQGLSPESGLERGLPVSEGFRVGSGEEPEGPGVDRPG